MAREDGPIEYATAMLFAAAACLSFHLAVTLPEAWRKAVHLLFAAGFLFCVGEEVSWGQRLFGFGTPDLIQEVNVQGEFNLHNLFGYVADHIFIAGVVIYGAIMPYLVYQSPFVHRLVDLSGLPIASFGLAAALAIVSLFHDWTIYAVLPRTPLRIAEARELLSAMGFVLLMLEAYRPRWMMSRRSRVSLP